MRLDDLRESVNVDDRRGTRLRRGGAIGGGAAVVALVLALLGAPKEVVQQVLQGGGQSVEEEQVPIDPSQAPLATTMKKVLGSTEDTWSAIFQRNGSRYQPPQLVLFSEAVKSACGVAGSAVGPFYCPVDRTVNIDLNFLKELDRRFGAPGDFAQAYVLAHEVGHHVQTLTGISEKVHARREAVSEVEGNRLSVKQELQADCYAGIWARRGWPRATVWTRATSRRGWARLPPSATIPCRSGPGARWCPRASPTVPPLSGCSGSARASTAATCLRATPSATPACSRSNFTGLAPTGTTGKGPRRCRRRCRGPRRSHRPAPGRRVGGMSCQSRPSEPPRSRNSRSSQRS